MIFLIKYFGLKISELGRSGDARQKSITQVTKILYLCNMRNDLMGN